MKEHFNPQEGNNNPVIRKQYPESCKMNLLAKVLLTIGLIGAFVLWRCACSGMFR